MTKKILLLVLSLPLILMICLFTTSNTVSLAISVPVTGIDIVGDNIVYLDMDKNETYEVEYTIYPTNAANKKISFSTEVIEGERLATLEYVDGKIIPKSSGAAKVYLTTVDGGHKDSFIVYVDSTTIQEIISTADKNQIYVGEKVTITNEFVPTNSSNQLVTYKSTNESVLKVEPNTNKIIGVGRGTADIIITSLANEEIFDTVTIEVLNTDAMDLSYTNLKTWNPTGSINISVDTPVEYEITYRILDESSKEFEKSPLKITLQEEVSDNVLATYSFENEFVGKVIIEFTLKTVLGLEVKKTCIIEKVNEVNVEFNYSEIPSFVQGTTTFLLFELTPEDAKVKYNVSLSNDNIIAEIDNGLLIIQTVKAGITSLTLEIEVDGVENSKKSASIDIVVKPTSFVIEETANTYGDEQLLTIGRTDINGQITKFKFNVSFGKTIIGANFLENVSWKSNNSAVIVKDGEVYIEDSSFEGIVEISVVYSYKTFKQETAVFQIRCVGSGINVYCYEDLLNATKEEKPIVLHNDIVDDFGKYKDGSQMNIKDVYTEITSTYDITYYKNIKREDLAKVKVLLSFKSDVYGNGKVINAHNITYKIDSTGALLSNALFTGPLNFVAVTETGASAVSVKGQDNICFALYEGSSLNNIQLKGCTLSSGSSDSYDLTDLNYIGTVVEVLGDNVQVNFSRISNGRTVRRIFGDVNDSSKVINVNINNSILSGAREFIIRMGSNHFVQGTKDNYSPYLDTNTKLSFPVYVEYKQKTEEQKKEYDNSYIKTFVTLKNCALKDCGIFSIGMDSHFSGELLANGKEYAEGSTSLNQLKELFEPWYDLAKTSYGAKLIFEGEVRMYDWKNLENVDSSTLIDISLKGGSFDSIFEKLQFDVKALVEVATGKEQFKNIVYTSKDGKQYVHGGIAFFGGGKNYSCFEDRTNEKFASLNGYQISLADVNSSYLNLAAGNEEFYFLLHDATTKNFLPEDQEKYLSSDSSAYDFVFKK